MDETPNSGQARQHRWRLIKATPKQRWASGAVSSAYTCFAVYGTVESMPSAPVTTCFVAGILFGFIAIFGHFPKSANLAEGGLELPVYEEVLDEAADDVLDDPAKAIAKVETVFRLDRKANEDPAALAKARTVFSTAVLAAARTVLAKPEDLVLHSEGSGEERAVVKATDGTDIVLDVEYLGTDLRTREAASLIRRLRAAGATKALVVTNSILTAKASDLLVLMAGPGLRLEVLSWESGPPDRLRLGSRLRQLGAATKP